MAEPGTVTTHVLDTAHGRPAGGMRIELYRLGGDEPAMLDSFVTNADGRTSRPVIPAGGLETGTYQLVFHVGAYFATVTSERTDTPFLDLVPVRFGIEDADQGYHVPLLVSPFGYSTYRGS